MSLPAVRPEGVLLRVEEARAILAECRRVDEAKSIRDKAEAVRAYLRQQGAAGEAQNDAAEIKIRAERRLGELLREQKTSGERHSGRAHAKRVESHAATPPLTLPDLGISRTQSSRWQDIAKVSEEKFEAFIAETRASGGEVTTSGLRREHVGEAKRQERAEREKAARSTGGGLLHNYFSDCFVDGCTKPAKGGRLCAMHARRRSRGQSLTDSPQERLLPWDRVKAAACALFESDADDNVEYQRREQRLRIAIIRWVRKNGYVREKA